MSRHDPKLRFHNLQTHGVGTKIACPKCGSENTYWRIGKRAWICRKCGQEFDAQFKRRRREKRES
jgi:ribosomal protein L37AE/L43A